MEYALQTDQVHLIIFNQNELIEKLSSCNFDIHGNDILIMVEWWSFWKSVNSAKLSTRAENGKIVGNREIAKRGQSGQTYVFFKRHSVHVPKLDCPHCTVVWACYWEKHISRIPKEKRHCETWIAMCVQLLVHFEKVVPVGDWVKYIQISLSNVLMKWMR